MASPGANCFAADVADDVDVVEVEVAPLGTATNPMASKYLPKRATVSGAKLAIDSGTAIGLAPLKAEASDAPARPPIIFSKASMAFPSMIALSISAPVMRGAAATCAPAELS